MELMRLSGYLRIEGSSMVKFMDGCQLLSTDKKSSGVGTFFYRSKRVINVPSVKFRDLVVLI